MSGPLKNMTPEEERLVMEIVKRTGKNLRTCLFCLRYKKGNYLKALEFCTDPDASNEESFTLISWWKAIWGKK